MVHGVDWAWAALEAVVQAIVSGPATALPEDVTPVAGRNGTGSAVNT